MTTSLTPQAAAAEAYVERFSWTLIPVWWVNPDRSCGCGDLHASNPKNIGKHPITQCVPRGLSDGSSDVEVIRDWWARFPQASPALVCSPSGLIVVDVDPRNGGNESLAELEASINLPPTLRAKTGGGGLHLFYSDAELNGGSPVGKIGPGLDIKWNGYVLLAPSSHVSGYQYAWDTTGVRPANVGELKDVICPDRNGNRNGQSSGQSSGGGGQPLDPNDASNFSAVDLDNLLAGVGEGDRHNSFKSFVARLRARRMSYVEARLMIEGAWAKVEQATSAPFGLDEALSLLDWAWRLPAGTTAERELEAYAAQMNWLNARFSAAPSSQGLGDQNTASTAENGLTSVWGPTGEPYHNGHTSPPTVQDRLMLLPEVLRMPVLEELKRHDVRQLARSIINASEFKAPRGDRLDQLLLYGVPEPVWTINSLHERGTNMSLTAQFKTGKTTLQLNMLKSLADGEPFLGHFDVEQLDGNIAFFNYELTEEQFVRWAGRMRIAHPEKVFVLNMRGLRLDLDDDYTREWVTAYLKSREVEFWFIDPLARAYYGNENDNTELKHWTDHVDEIKHEAGVIDCQVSLHTGRGEQEEGNERARGATRIDDWVDGRMVLTRQGDHRFFRASGREVDVPEMMLVFNAELHRLEVSNLTPVDRRTAQVIEGIEFVVDVLRRAGAISQATAITRSTLRNTLRQGKFEARDRWILAAIRDGVVTEVPGARSGTVLWLTGNPMRSDGGGGVDSDGVDGASDGVDDAGSSGTGGNDNVVTFPRSSENPWL